MGWWYAKYMSMYSTRVWCLLSSLGRGEAQGTAVGTHELMMGMFYRAVAAHLRGQVTAAAYFASVDAEVLLLGGN